MSDRIDTILDLIDGALSGGGDRMRWTPELPKSFDPIPDPIAEQVCMSAADARPLPEWQRQASEALTEIARFVTEWAHEVADALAPLARLIEQIQASGGNRHGTSAVCPRHGATRGGTCWKCRR